MAYLARSGLTYQSIRSYLAGVRFLQIACGLLDPDLAAAPVLNYILRGVHCSPPANPHTPRLPRRFWAYFFHHGHKPPRKTVAMPPCCGQHVAQPSLAFSELASSHAHCRPLNHLCLGHRMSQWILMRTLVLSQSICGIPRLTCLARELGSILGEQDRLCVLCLHFWVTWSAAGNNIHGPLFLFQDGSTLSKQRLLARVNVALACQGFDTMGISGHSFHDGAATTAARV